MTELTLTCEKCRRPIKGDAGGLSLSFGALERRRVAEAGWKAAHPGTLHTTADLLSLPEDVPWRPFHDSCRPDSIGDSYEIDADRLSSWRGLTRWTAHLMAKAWLPLTDWDALLREVADGKSSRLIVTARSAA